MTSEERNAVLEEAAQVIVPLHDRLTSAPLKSGVADLLRRLVMGVLADAQTSIRKLKSGN
jgi:hypothetical protein